VKGSRQFPGVEIFPPNRQTLVDRAIGLVSMGRSSNESGAKPMPAFTIYDVFNRNHPRWLHHRTRRGQHISRADVERIVKLNPGCEREDPLVRDLLDPAQAGQLKRRRGRPEAEFKVMHCALFLADEWIKERTAEIWAERRAGKARLRTDLSPVLQAAKEYAHGFGCGTGGELLNRISKRRKLGLL
jgi:hypothetical protein